MGEIHDAQKTDGVLVQTHVGGQALIEGIMMRGRYNWAAAIRQPDGSIYTEQHDLASGRDENGWMHKPVVRGCTALVESLMLGYKALEVSAEHAYDFDEEDDQSDVEDDPCSGIERVESEEDDQDSEIGKGTMVFSMVLGLVLGIALFIMVPVFLTNLLVGDYGEHTFIWNLAEGLIRVGVFILYIWAISFMKDIHRMFSYHGAEHKVIHCYEHGCELTPEEARVFPRLHVRCGTAFLIITLLIAIIVFTIVPIQPLITALGVTNTFGRLGIVIASRIVLFPVIAGLAYEVTVKWAGSHPDNPLVKVVLWPGMQMQRLTTKQPDDDMLECAIAAMQLVLEREEAEVRLHGTQQASGLLPLRPHVEIPSTHADNSPGEREAV